METKELKKPQTKVENKETKVELLFNLCHSQELRDTLWRMQRRIIPYITPEGAQKYNLIVWMVTEALTEMETKEITQEETKVQLLFQKCDTTELRDILWNMHRKSMACSTTEQAQEENLVVWMILEALMEIEPK